MNKKDVKKQDYLIALIIVFCVAFIFCFNFYEKFKDNKGSKDIPISCNNSIPCLPKLERYCLTSNVACNFTTYYNCSLDKCVPVSCRKECINCGFEQCVDGQCVNMPVNKSDLTISNITYSIDSNRVFVFVEVKNIGYETAPASITRILINPSTQIFPLNTPALSSGQLVSFNPIEYTQPAGTNYEVKVTADAEHQVDESYENNNVVQITIRN